MRTTLEKFQAHGGQLRTDDLDFDSFVERPLDPGVLRCLAYMHDIEYQTVLYTRELLMTRAWQDPQLTGFLTLWNYEEYWHGEAIGRVLERHGRPAHDERLVEMRRWNRRQLSYSPAVFWALGRFVRHFPVVHMAWGAINEWTANAAYNRLAQISEHPVLSELLGRIMRQEGRHASFYASWARDGLEGDRRAQRVTRWFLNHEWDIVGTGDVPRIETSFTAAYLFGGDEGRELLERVESRVDALPGLAGLGLIRRGIDDAIAHVREVEGDVPTPGRQRTDASRAARPAVAVGQNV